MSMRHLSLLRRFSSTRILQRPTLSADYKSKTLWGDRFNCDLLGSESTLIKIINNKIISGTELSNLEIDIFINIATPRTKDVAQLQEAASSLKKFRKTIYANTLLPSTSHAFCRLFIDSNRLEPLVTLLEKRVEFGIFHDPYVMNLMFDAALEKDNFALGSRLAALIMIQEEFGQDPLNDNFALYSLAKYIESKTDFSDWSTENASDNQIFFNFNANQGDETTKDETQTGQQKNQQEKVDEDGDDEDDAEYIRVPFLRNPYFDNHFDLTDPRSICGKSLKMLGHQHQSSTSDSIRTLGSKCKLAGNILQSNWKEAQMDLNNCVKSKAAANSTFIDVLKHYVDSGKDVDKVKGSLMSELDKLPTGGLCLSEEADGLHKKLGNLEKQHIEQFKLDIINWSKARHDVKRNQEEMNERERLIAEIRAKKEELRTREQYLYFYDNLKKTNLTRINYD